MTSAFSPASRGRERTTSSGRSRTTSCGHPGAAAPGASALGPTGQAGSDAVPPVVVTDLSVVLGSAVILSGIDLTVSGGESMALLGANGSGKSTLVRTILGLHPVDAGGVHLFGHDVRRRSHVPWSRIGYVPQRVGAASGVPATALEVVRSGLLDPRRPFDDRGRRARTRAMAALEAVGLAHRARDHVQIFSGGQAQRVLIARASRQALAEILASLHDRGLTLITVLHEMGELSDVVERAVVLVEGRVSADGPAHDLAPSSPGAACHGGRPCS